MAPRDADLNLSDLNSNLKRLNPYPKPYTNPQSKPKPYPNNKPHPNPNPNFTSCEVAKEIYVLLNAKRYLFVLTKKCNVP